MPSRRNNRCGNGRVATTIEPPATPAPAPSRPRNSSTSTMATPCSDKRRRQDAASPASTSIDLTTSPPPPQRKTSPPTLPHFKSEEDESTHQLVSTLPATEVVTIHAGTQVRPYRLPLTALERSPFLKAHLNTSDPGSPYVMHPLLLQLNNGFFKAVVQFVTHDFYTPKTEEDEENGRVILKGMEETSRAYSRELERGWGVWEVGRRLRVQGLCAYVLERMRSVSWMGYDDSVLLEGARKEFVRGDLMGAQAGCGDGDGRVDGEAMEEWVVDQVAKRFDEIMLANARLLLDVVKLTSWTIFYERVLRRKADLVNEVRHEAVVIS